MPHSLKVLIMEDSPDQAELLVSELRRAGFAPEWKQVDNEAEYLDRLQEGMNLVLSSYHTSKFSGMRALELLKQGGLEIPFILVSDASGEDVAVNAMKQGATDYLIKSRLNRLGEAVSQALESSRLRTERRQLEQQLLLQGTALMTVETAISVTDIAGTIRWINPAFTALTGYTAVEAVGQTLRLLKSGKHDCKIYENLWATVLSGKTWKGCFTNRRKDGSLYYDEQIITPVRTADGIVTHFVSIMTDVTERRSSENALQSAHAQLRDLLTHSPAVLYTVKVDGEKIIPQLASPNVGGLLGFEVAEILEPDWWRSRVHPDDRDRALASFPETLSRGISRAEYRIRHKDGRYRWIEDTRRVVRTEPGQAAEVVGVWSDITERKQTEDALRESERRFRELIESVELIAVTLDNQGSITFCNDYFLRLTGWQREQVIGANWFGTFIPDADTETKKRFFETVVGKTSSHHENSIKTRSGAMRQIAWNSTMFRDAAGNIVGAAGIGEDVTDRKQAEVALRSSEERFRQVVENIHEVFWMIDVKNHTVLYVSPGYEAIWGRPCQSLYAAPELRFECIHELDRDRVAEAASTKQVLGNYDETYRIVRPDGAVRWVRDRAFPVNDKTGVASRVVGVVEDITERKKFEDQFLRGQRLESIGMLASGIVHDLNNVLTPIAMVVPLLRTNTTEVDDLRLLDTLEQCAERGSGLVQQILSFVHGRGDEPRIVQVKHLLRDNIGVIVETFPKSITFQEDVPSDLWPIWANPTQIHQVVLNLCVNARDAMPDGGLLRLRAENVMLDETAASEIKGGRAGAWLVLHVEDTGTGIAPEVLNRIWEPFFTTKASEKGTGLGLSTVCGIVDAHHGFITLRTEVGRGSVFRVYLPAEKTAVVGGTGTPLQSVSRGHSELILFVDDEQLIRKAARFILEHAGYRVIVASDGQEAAQLFESRASEVALVITDRDMPILDGAGLVKLIRARNSTIKILLVSGLTSSGRGEDFPPENFADAFVAKPFTAEALLDAVEQLLAQVQPVST